MFGGRGGGARTPEAGPAGGAEADAGGGGDPAAPGESGRPAEASTSEEPADRARAMATIQELRTKVQEGEISQDSMRAAIQALRAAGGGRPGEGAAQAARGDGGVTERETRPAAVFVLGPDSIPEPRLVQLGIGDWDSVEIVSGLEGGETLVVVGPAQLQARQDEFLERMRSRMGGSPFGGGGRR